MEPLDDQLEGQLGTLLGALNNDKDEKEREDDCREGTGAGVDSSIAEEKAPEEPRGRKRPSPSLGDEVIYIQWGLYCIGSKHVRLMPWDIHALA